MAAALVMGFRKPRVGATAAGYAVALFSTLMARRLQRKLGTLTSPPDCPIFLPLAAFVLAEQLAE
jgi:hypothetical protein